MVYSIQFTLLARQDAQDYAAFIRDEQNSPAPARRWLDGLNSAIEKLAEAPRRFAVVPEAEELGFPYRSLAYHSHRVIYAVNDDEERVTVIRVYHSARKPLTGNDIQ